MPNASVLFNRLLLSIYFILATASLAHTHSSMTLFIAKVYQNKGLYLGCYQKQLYRPIHFRQRT
jgi:hypothetical protein